MEPIKPKRGRKSKLSDVKKDEIRKRLLAGEGSAGLGREYGVDEKVIRRIKAEPAKDEDGTPRLPVDQIKEAARKSLENDLNDPVVRSLLDNANEEDRGLFYSHKADLAETALQLSLSAKLHAQNAHKLAAMAQNHFNKLDLESPLTAETRPILADAMELTACSNESSKQPLKLFEIAGRNSNAAPPGPRKVILINEPDV